MQHYLTFSSHFGGSLDELRVIKSGRNSKSGVCYIFLDLLLVIVAEQLNVDSTPCLHGLLLTAGVTKFDVF